MAHCMAGTPRLRLHRLSRQAIDPRLRRDDQTASRELICRCDDLTEAVEDQSPGCSSGNALAQNFRAVRLRHEPIICPMGFSGSLRSGTIFKIAKRGTARSAPGMPQIVSQKNSETITSTGFKVK